MERRRPLQPVPAELWALGQEVNKLAYRLEALEDGRGAVDTGLGALRERIRTLEGRIDTLARRLPPQR
jgi:hypothetical protein